MESPSERFDRNAWQREWRVKNRDRAREIDRQSRELWGFSMLKRITQRGWSFITDEGGLDADFFETTRPIPAWSFLKAIRVTRTITYELPKKRVKKQRPDDAVGQRADFPI